MANHKGQVEITLTGTDSPTGTHGNYQRILNSGLRCGASSMDQQLVPHANVAPRFGIIHNNN